MGDQASIRPELERQASIQSDAAPSIHENSNDVPGNSVGRRNTLEYQPGRYNVTAAVGARILLIINNVVFTKAEVTLDERVGSNEDVKKIEETFAELGWKTADSYILENPTKGEITEKIQELKSLKKKVSCIAVFIMSHGGKKGSLWADDRRYSLYKNVIDQLSGDKCPCLTGKPKLIFIQACQGSRDDRGNQVKMPKNKPIQDSSESRGANSHFYRDTQIPSCSDIFVFKASYTGYVSYRDPTAGSWFIQSLCKEIHDSSPGMDLFAIALKVTKSVSEKETQSPKMKQIPHIQSTLLLNIHLKPSDVSSNPRQVTSAEAPSYQEPIVTPAIVRDIPSICINNAESSESTQSFLGPVPSTKPQLQGANHSHLREVRLSYSATQETHTVTIEQNFGNDGRICSSKVVIQ